MNAIVYGSDVLAGDLVQLELAENDEGVLFRVHDRGSGIGLEAAAAMSKAGADLAENGRGLMLVETLSHAWGYFSDADGTTVYFLLRTAKTDLSY